MTNQRSESAMPPEAFAAFIEERLQDQSDAIEVVARERMQLKLLVRGKPVSANLDSAYRAYLARPDQVDAVVQTLVRVLRDELPTETARNYAELSDRVYPMLKPAALLQEVRARNVPPIAYREFLGDLIIAYVIDEQRSVAYINEDHLDHWEVDVAELHVRALENLRARTSKLQVLASGEGDRRFYVYNSMDGYDATRLLLTDVLAGWAASVPGALVIGVPNRDFLIAFSDADEDVFDGVARQIEADAAAQNHSLTEQLFTLRDGAIELYEV